MGINHTFVKIRFLEALERIHSSNDLLTIIIMVILLLLVIAKTQFQNRFEDFISLLTSGKYLVIKSKEHKALFGFNILMLNIHILSISIFLFLCLRIFKSTILEEPEIILLQVITAYSTFILVKFVFEKIIANVFDIDEVIDFYLFQKHSYRNFISLALLPFSILMVYTLNPGLIFLNIIFGLLIISIIYIYWIVIKKNELVISKYWFYFILYLCALEIAPYIILFKLITFS